MAARWIGAVQPGGRWIGAVPGASGGPATISPAGIGSSEAGGTPSLGGTPGTIAPPGVASSEADGNPSAASATAYNLFADTAYHAVDHRSNFWHDAGATTAATVGDTVACFDTVSASGLSFRATLIAGATASATLQQDGAGNKFLRFPAGAIYAIPTSTAFDALFTATGPAGGNGFFAVFNAPNTGGGWLAIKSGSAASNSNTVTGQIAISNNVNLPGWVQRYLTGGAISYRPYAGGFLASGAIVNESATGTLGGTPNYRDGSQVYYQGVPVSKSFTNTLQLNTADGEGCDLNIGGLPWLVGIDGFVGDMPAFGFWSRAPKHHEVLLADRAYRTALGMTDPIVGQPAILVWEGNSEATVPIGAGEPGIVDRCSAGLGIATDATLSLARASRKGAEIASDYDAWTAPLLATLAALYPAIPVAVHLWEIVNDGYGLPGAASYVDYYNLIKLTSVHFSVSTAMSGSLNTTSCGPAGTNAVCAANVQVVADGATNGYPVGRIGTDPDSPVSNYVSADFSDGLHWQPPAIEQGAPWFVGAISRSLGWAAFAVAPSSVAAGSTGNSLTLTGTATAWYTNSGIIYPTFTVDSGTITGEGITSATAASLAFDAPGSSGAVTITDPTTMLTATVAVQSSVTLAPSGIGSGEDVASPAASSGPGTIPGQGIGSGESVASPSVSQGTPTITIPGIGSGESVASPSVSPGNPTVSVPGIGSGEVVASPSVSQGTPTIAPSGIGSVEVVGEPVVAGTAGPITINPPGIPSGETDGTPVATSITVSAIPTAFTWTIAVSSSDIDPFESTVKED